MDREPTKEQIEAELLQIKHAASDEAEPAESLDELVARKRREQGIYPKEAENGPLQIQV